MSALSPELELRSVLEEMHADAVWMTLDREAQMGWLRWIEGSGEEPRMRMYQTANKLLEGKRRPPRFVRLRAFLGAYLDGPWW